MICLDNQFKNFAFKAFYHFWDQFSEAFINTINQNRTPELGTPYQMIIDLVCSVSCSFSHSKLIIPNFCKGGNAQFPTPLKQGVPLR